MSQRLFEKTRKQYYNVEELVMLNNLMGSLNKKGKKIKKSMVKQYGKKKGEAVFYAMENSGKLDVYKSELRISEFVSKSKYLNRNLLELAVLQFMIAILLVSLALASSQSRYDDIYVDDKLYNDLNSLSVFS